MKGKLIFKKPIAEQLQEKGHILLDAFPNRNNPQMLVFKFMDTERLQKDLRNILNTLA